MSNSFPVQPSPSGKPRRGNIRIGLRGRQVKEGEGAKAVAKERVEEEKIEGSKVRDRKLGVYVNTLDDKVLDGFKRLNKAGMYLVDRVMKKDEKEIERALGVIDEISWDESGIVKEEVGALIGLMSRIEEVWERCGEYLMEILDRLCEDWKAGDLAKAIRAGCMGVGKKNLDNYMVLKGELKVYARLNYFAVTGGRRMKKLKEKDPTKDLHKMPSGYEVMGLSDLPEGIRERGNEKEELKAGEVVFDKETGLIRSREGLKAALFKGPDEKMVLCFAGSKAEYGKHGRRFRATWGANIVQGMGWVPELYEQGRGLVADLKEKYPNLVVTGHSLGGAMAQYAGGMARVPTYCMNSAGLETGVLREMVKATREGDEGVGEWAKSNVKNIWVTGELLHEVLEGGIGGVLLGEMYEVGFGVEGDVGVGERLRRHDLGVFYDRLRGIEEV